jgi:hypothetical protein
MHVNTTNPTATGNPITFGDALQKVGYTTGYFGNVAVCNMPPRLRIHASVAHGLDAPGTRTYIRACVVYQASI